MTEKEFLAFFIRMVESQHLDPDTAQKILQRILAILYDTDGYG